MGTTIPQILHTRATTTPDKTAYIYLHDGEENAEHITYQQLHEDACSIAALLLKNHRRGERALMLFHPGTHFLRALYGCFYAGIIAVPAYAPRKNRSLDRIKTLVADCSATIVLSESGIHDAFNRSFSDLEELKSMHWITVDNREQASANRSVAPILALPDEIALLQYTSGSTGQPKGVMVTHANIACNNEFLRQSFSLTTDSVSVSWLPAFHDMGLIEAVLEPVYTGFPGVLMPPVAFIQKPVRWLRAIQKYKGTHGGAPNFAFDLCVDGIPEAERKGLDLSTMETLYSGSEPVRKETFERFVEAYAPYGIKAQMLNPSYGMAETTLIISGPPALRGPVYLGVSASAFENNLIITGRPNDTDTRYLVGVGKPWLDTEVIIVDPETTIPITDNRIGEIWVAGSIVTAGYWNNEVLTGEVYRAQIFNDNTGKHYLRTGDLGFFFNGELFITGRLKDLIILQGKNYYPQDIEYLTEQAHPAIRSAAVAAFSAEIGNSERLVIVAEVERTYLRNFNAEEISNAIREAIAGELEQDVYAVLLLRTTSIPKTSSGKIQRKACKQGFLGKTLDIVGASYATDSPSTALPDNSGTASAKSADNSPDVDALEGIQSWLIAWVHSKLNIAPERIDIQKYLTLYGLNSLKAIQLQQDILDKYKVNIPPYLLFDNLSLKELSSRILKTIKETSVA